MKYKKNLSILNLFIFILLVIQIEFDKSKTIGPIQLKICPILLQIFYTMQVFFFCIYFDFTSVRQIV